MAGPLVPASLVIALAEAAKSIADAVKSVADAYRAKYEKKKRRWWPWRKRKRRWWQW